MKSKKIFSGVLCSAALTMLLSTAAFAASTNYSFRLPATGSRYTGSIAKGNKLNVGYNYAHNVGWDGSGINCWVNFQRNGSRITATSYYSKPCTVNMYYGASGSDYYGHSVNMQIKTDTSTWHECNVSGVFEP